MFIMESRLEIYFTKPFSIISFVTVSSRKTPREN